MPRRDDMLSYKGLPVPSDVVQETPCAELGEVRAALHWVCARLSGYMSDVQRAAACGGPGSLPQL